MLETSTVSPLAAVHVAVVQPSAGGQLVTLVICPSNLPRWVRLPAKVRHVDEPSHVLENLPLSGTDPASAWAAVIPDPTPNRPAEVTRTATVLRKCTEPPSRSSDSPINLPRAGPNRPEGRSGERASQAIRDIALEQLTALGCDLAATWPRGSTGAGHLERGRRRWLAPAATILNAAPPMAAGRVGSTSASPGASRKMPSWATSGMSSQRAVAATLPSASYSFLAERVAAAGACRS